MNAGILLKSLCRLCFVDNDDMKILLFVQFCSSDFVQVSDSSQSLNWIFCGKIAPFAVTFSQSYVTVRLKSDNGIEENGFHARYLVVKDGLNLGTKSRFDNAYMLLNNKPSLAYKVLIDVIIFILKKSL